MKLFSIQAAPFRLRWENSLIDFYWMQKGSWGCTFTVGKYLLQTEKKIVFLINNCCVYSLLSSLSLSFSPTFLSRYRQIACLWLQTISHKKKNQKNKHEKNVVWNLAGDGGPDAAKPQDDPSHVEANGDTLSPSTDEPASSAKSKRGSDKHYLSGTSYQINFSIFFFNIFSFKINSKIIFLSRFF